MAKDPAFLLYSQDFLIGCAEMTHEEIGQYFRILLFMHQKGRLKQETIWLLVGSVSVNVLSKFSTDNDGFLFNNRLESEISKRQKYVESRHSNGSKGGRPSKNKLPNGKPYANHMEDENDNEDDSIKINIEFDFFWNEYDKKVGLREKIKKKWESLKDEERETAMQHIPKYKQSQPDKKYRKDPATYLNNKSFNDEIINNANTNQTGGGKRGSKAATNADLAEYVNG